MKKSVFTLLAIAATVFTMSSCSQNDGGSSNDVNFSDNTKSKDNPSSSTDFTYQYQVAASNDALDFFDITATRTIAGKTTTYDINKSSKITVTDIKGNVTGEYDSKSMDCDTFGADNKGAVNVAVKVSLKSNWQSVLASKEDGKINILYEVTKIATEKGKSNKFNNIYNPHLKTKSEYTKEKLEEFAADMSELLSYSNK